MRRMAFIVFVLAVATHQWAVAAIASTPVSLRVGWLAAKFYSAVLMRRGGRRRMFTRRWA